MIKAKATLEGDRPLFLFGLTASNLQKLRHGEPIRLDLEEMGGAGEILIMYGETEDTLLRELQDFIGPSTAVHGLDGDAN